jgi:osmotically-inducible protein OsmY
MKKSAFCICAASVILLIGCGDYSGGKQASTSGKAKSNYGSATDITRGSDLPSNAVNSADNGIGGPMQRQTGNYQARPASGSDEELASQIKVALTTGSTGTTGAIPEKMLTAIGVQVHQGEVTLSGPVASEDEKKSIGKQVAAFEGVRAVRNNLTVGDSRRNQNPLQPMVPRAEGNQ